MVSLIIQTLNSSANQPLYTSFIKFDVKDFSSLIKRNLQYLYADQEVRKVFTPDHLFLSGVPEI